MTSELEEYLAQFEFDPIPREASGSYRARRIATHRKKKRFENGYAVEVVKYQDGSHTFFIYRPDGMRMDPTDYFPEHIKRWNSVTTPQP